LDGILYPQRMAELGTLGFVEEIQRLTAHSQEVEA
jgi:hypothetical protein